MAKWHCLADLAFLDEGDIHPFRLGSFGVVLVRQGNQIACFLDQCAHQPVKLSEFGDIYENQILCNAHGAKFDCLKGTVVKGPATEALKRFETKLEGGKVFVLFEGD